MEDGDTGRTRAAAKCGTSEVDHTAGAAESCMSAALLPPHPLHPSHGGRGAGGQGAARLLMPPYSPAWPAVDPSLQHPAAASPDVSELMWTEKFCKSEVLEKGGKVCER